VKEVWNFARKHTFKLLATLLLAPLAALHAADAPAKEAMGANGVTY
jgi:hypothetical protein